MNRKDVCDSEPNRQPEGNPVAKRPYQAPTFRCERVFVSLINCGKVFDTEENCKLASPKVS